MRTALGVGLAVALLAMGCPEAAAVSPFGRMSHRLSLVEARAELSEESTTLLTPTPAVAGESTAELSEVAAPVAAEASDLAVKNAALQAVVNADAAKLADQRAALVASQNAALGGAVPVPAVAESSEQAELQSIRSQAEAQAAETIRQATATARDLIAKAKAASQDCGENCGSAPSAAKNDEWRDVVLLTPSAGAGEINDQALGLAPTMSVDTPTIKHAGDVLKKAENFHDKFIDETERNCALPDCPLNQNFRVGQ